MKSFAEIPGMLAFHRHSLQVQAERRSIWSGVAWYSIGFLAYAIVRNLAYADLPEIAYRQFSLIGAFLDLNLVQSLIFLLLVYVPALIILGNFFSGNGLGLSISQEEYKAHISALLPLWGALFLIAAPLQWVESRFLVLLPSLRIFAYDLIFEISFGMLIRSILLVVYTIWAIKQLNYLSVVQSLGVFALSWSTLPILQILSSFFYALPFFIMIPVFYLAFRWFREHFASQANERSFQQNLQVLTLNPQDADAHYQLGLIHFKRRNFDSARRYFENALKIQPADPDYHYYLGRTCELNEEWQLALEQYEETYRLNPEYGLGDISREVGKAYLHTGSVEKSKEFFEFFLKNRSSDPEGRYWLAVTLQRLGDTDQMRFQLHTLLEQARSAPRFFRKENREWMYRARTRLRDSKSGFRD
jgi:tetratricopeptide (TPR) repeat protein